MQRRLKIGGNMPKCKYCGARITKFDKDICPVCGGKEPLAGVSSETIEITSNLDLSEAELKEFKPTTKFRAFMLFCFLGWTGAPLFYLDYYYQALVWLFINLAFIGGIGSIFAFVARLGFPWGYLLALAIAYIFNIGAGLFVFFKHNLKDGRGEFLR